MKFSTEFQSVQRNCRIFDSVLSLEHDVFNTYPTCNDRANKIATTSLRHPALSSDKRPSDRWILIFNSPNSTSLCDLIMNVGPVVRGLEVELVEKCLTISNDCFRTLDWTSWWTKGWTAGWTALWMAQVTVTRKAMVCESSLKCSNFVWNSAIKTDKSDRFR